MAAPSLGTPIADQSIRSVNFFNGRLLTGGDLSREQQARRAADAQLGGSIGPGIAGGLEVVRLDGSTPDLVKVFRGLAVSASGRVLMLGTDPTIRLVQTGTETGAQAAGSGDFGACGALPGIPYVAGDGVFLLTLAPATIPEGSVPVLALEAANARCNTDSWVEAVKLRLLRIDGWEVSSTEAATVANLRNRIAYEFLREPAWQSAHRNPGTSPLAAPAVAGLTDCDVPLALVYMVGPAVVFVDAWGVRRRIAAAAASEPWGVWLGARPQALAEARMLQFQAQIVDTPALLAAAAAPTLKWLPPAGFLPGTTNWRTFLGARAPANEVALAAGDAPDVLAGALGGDAIDLTAAGTAPRLRVYRIGGSGGPLLFVRDARNVHHAEQVWFDGARADLPGADDVQEAIDQLRAGTCLHRVLRPGMKPEEALAGLKKGSDLMLCIEPGTYTMGAPLVVSGLGRVQIRGHGATLVNAGGECALLVEECDALDIAELALEGRKPGSGKDERGIGLYGALTVIDTPRIHIERVRARCASADQLRAACIVAGLRTELVDKLPAPHVSVADCEIDVGVGQQGLLVLNPGVAQLRRNSVVAREGKGAMQRGIVVAGRAAGLVQIEGNVVRDAVRGIAVGISDKGKESDPPLVAQRVQIERNQVTLRIDEATARDRYGLFVGNADSALVLGNHVKFPGELAMKLEVHGLRLHGTYGPQVVVRDNLFDGPLIAVAFQPVGGPGKLARLWVIEDNAARGDEDGMFESVTDSESELIARDNRRLPRDFG